MEEEKKFGAESVAALDESVALQPKPLSQNGFVAFWQKIWRWWQGGWYSYSEKHPKLSGLIYMVFFFFVFSMGVTVWQYLVMLFLPYAFAGLADINFVWPAVNLGDLTYTAMVGTEMKEMPLQFAIFNEPIKYLADGSVDLKGGLGNFIAFEIAVFTAQCINFPLQRNITFRSHGNPVIQAIWYFIGWVLISVFVNAVWGIIAPFVRDLWAWPAAVCDLLKTFITGGVSMIIFFFIFLIIFPDVKKTEASKKAKLDAASSALEEAKKGGNSEAIAKAQAAYDKAALDYEVAVENRKVYDSEKAIASAKSVAEAKINGYYGMIKQRDKAQEALAAAKAANNAEQTAAAEKAVADAENGVEKIKEEALKAVANRDEVVPKEEAVLAEVKAAREARGVVKA